MVKGICEDGAPYYSDSTSRKCPSLSAGKPPEEPWHLKMNEFFSGSSITFSLEGNRKARKFPSLELNSKTFCERGRETYLQLCCWQPVKELTIKTKHSGKSNLYFSMQPGNIPCIYFEVNIREAKYSKCCKKEIRETKFIFSFDWEQKLLVTFNSFLRHFEQMSSTTKIFLLPDQKSGNSNHLFILFQGVPSGLSIMICHF